MSDPWALLIVIGLVLLGTCVALGFLAGIACWQERESRRVRRELRDRRPLREEGRPGSTLWR